MQEKMKKKERKKMTLQRAENFLHEKQCYGKHFYKKISF